MKKDIFLKAVGVLAVPVIVLGGIAALNAKTSVPLAEAASSDMFLQIEGVEGESVRNEIEVLSWSWGASNAGSMSSGSGMGSGKVSMQDFHFMKRFDKASPLLMKALASGKHFPTATLRITGEDGEPLEITLKEVFVSSYGLSGPGAPTESLSLNFQKIEFRKSGDLITTWDLKKGTK
jgi:type VI secretion system secreted protein Hcp